VTGTVNDLPIYDTQKTRPAASLNQTSLPTRRADMADEPIKSVWYDVQAEQGAEFEDFDGWLWTSTLGDANKEYESIRSDVAVWDVYPLVKWDFSVAMPRRPSSGSSRTTRWANPSDRSGTGHSSTPTG
jgi:hypothetical protein